MDNKERFISICNFFIERAGITQLLDYVEATDFFTAPASTRFHGAHEGGLLEHSLCVYDNLVDLAQTYAEELSFESMTIVSLFHDVCKADFYTKTFRNVKNYDADSIKLASAKDIKQDPLGRFYFWDTQEGYSVYEKLNLGGHGSKSLFIVQQFIRLSAYEAAAILCHMGEYDASKYSNPSSVFSNNKLAYLLHVADGIATHIFNK